MTPLDPQLIEWLHTARVLFVAGMLARSGVETLRIGEIGTNFDAYENIKTPTLSASECEHGHGATWIPDNLQPDSAWRWYDSSAGGPLTEPPVPDPRDRATFLLLCDELERRYRLQLVNRERQVVVRELDRWRWAVNWEDEERKNWAIGLVCQALAGNAPEPTP